ncbi:succinylglutamate desuccinylase [Pandoraea nosoerga]|uniref:Succinylglutamate desuccinylase n=1 Tax=Pandoraea nosoerga TaxID=2508296 RepID=A0A5E4SG43_9BURK|nr:succinylglutamate desuccinylase [Pandoraea nosoerga]MBN4665321.1 succinylglutamate desuccinylase [Pandoraea nosoerga]MBN4674721.1 succinylglutamate desuccinylase [Pandoraea nosoerga]MBN4680610.1 succinylglutamate desuccinylase [Pandoraea nosoerga]MBN4744015.1 succinylglutamate desuccinylase [Pandoraea nosoerga]VVD74627.1 succinylglutamate desuccinylase [Pandoraea nosoerga]
MTPVSRSALRDWLSDVLDARDTSPGAGVDPCGVRWQRHAHGVLELAPAARAGANGDDGGGASDVILRGHRFDAILSCGIHGDETAPIEIVDGILRDIADARLTLRERVLVVLGNPEAVRAGKRYLEYDLNRLFQGAHAKRAESPAVQRARELEVIVAQFFAGVDGVRRVRRHVDMHTAIRASLYPRFAVVPSTPQHAASDAWVATLAATGIEAVVLTDQPSATFSYYTCARFGAESCTLELGKVAPFGQNQLADFAGIDAALRRWLSGGEMGERDDARTTGPRRFRVAAEIVRRTDAFVLDVPADTPNFTPYPAGTVLARDGENTYTVSHPEECIVFPNPNVANGLRAGVMVVPE